jgi:hypothetical protein
MSSRIADLLNKARSASFIGREKELALFDKLDEKTNDPVFLLYYYGTAGQGKTVLLKRLRDLCDQRNYLNINLNGRDFTPQPAVFLEAMQNQLPDCGNEDFFESLAALQKRVVLFLDSYERFSPIDDWLRQDFLPKLPDNVCTVIASRRPPSPAFLSDPGWQMLMRTMQLRNFHPDESKAFLRRRNIPADKVPAILDFTHGHPLALSVVADIYEQQPDQNFRPEESPDILRTLLDRFIQEVPSANHRRTLEICALSHLTTESLLAKVLDVQQADHFFDWLRGLSFIDSGKYGLSPHDLVREAIVADLRWRHPDRFIELHEKIGAYYKKRLKEVSGEMQRAILFDLVFLHRTNPVVRPFFNWETGSHWMDFIKPDDIPRLTEMVVRFEGQNSAAHFEYWVQHPAAETWVWRDHEKNPAAFVLRIDMHKITDPKSIPDPAVIKIMRYRDQHLNLRSGEQFPVFRFWMAQETYQGVSALQSSVFLAIVQYYFTPGVAVHLINMAQPKFWEAVFNYADLHHVPELDFMNNETPMGFYTHDWRKRPPVAWLELLGKREIGASAGMNAPLETPGIQLLVLSEASFADAVNDALRSWHSGQDLEKNPLLSSRFIINSTGTEATEHERIQALKSKIATAIKDIEGSPLDSKYHRVLYRTFINPVGSQEKTADFLNMSFSTYRRYLKSGMEKVIERLWREEIE